MADYSINSASLHTIESGLKAINSNLGTLNENLKLISNKVDKVNSNVKIVYDELSALAQDFTDTIDDWLLIDYDGIVGWVNGEYPGLLG